MSQKASTKKPKPETLQELDVFQIEDPDDPLHPTDDPLTLLDLANSIKTHGQISPIIVRKKNDHYKLVIGYRRLRASKEHGIPTLKSIVTTKDDVGSILMAMDENIMRTPSNPLAELLNMKKLRDTYKLKLKDIAERAGKSPETISNKLRMLELPQELIPEIEAGRLTTGVSMEILRLPTSQDRIALGRDIASSGRTVMATRSLVDQYIRVKEMDATQPPEERAKEVLSNPQRECGHCHEQKHPMKFNIVEACDTCIKKITYLLEKDRREHPTQKP